ncbi:AsmA family protein [Lichenihabitans psoromatis]|uniref:AsmA family protein n=1 Tax=Lichenihabitans psoromatis TaxID=2528642 RepID=UPI0013F14A68|nr:AsmA-like C-terminal region-containing protein [Lichenihabitans psoromatis]
MNDTTLHRHGTHREPRRAALGSGMVIRASIVGAVLLALATIAAGFLVRWPITDHKLYARAVRFIATSSGLNVRATGPMTLVLLPRPTVRIRDIDMHGLDDAISLNADAITGSLSLPALLTGRLRIAKTTLAGLTMAVDVDRVLPPLTAMVQAAGDPAERKANRDRLGFLHTDGLTIRSGIIRLRSNDPEKDILVTDLDGTFEWPANDSGVSLNGRGHWHGEPTDLAILLDKPITLIEGGSSEGYGHLKSTAIDVTLSGTLNGTGSPSATGKIAASTTMLPGFLRSIGTPLPQLEQIASARLNGDITLADHVVSMSSMELGLDDMLFDGALSFHNETGHPGIAGTLATDRMRLDPFVNTLPPLGRWDQAWNTDPFATRSVAYDDIDLRISASSASFGSIEFEDGGLSLQSRDGRMEVSLGEARAYDGLFKGRLVATVDGDATVVRADATITQLDLAALGRAFDPPLQITGTSSGHMTIEGRGTSPDSLIRSLAGRGQVNVRDGEIGAPLVASVLKTAVSPSDDTPELRTDAPIPFDSVMLGLSVAKGVMTLDEGWMTRPDLRAMFDGHLSLADRSADLRTWVTPNGDDSRSEAGRAMGLRLAGPWRMLRLQSVPVDVRGTPAPVPDASQ